MFCKYSELLKALHLGCLAVFWICLWYPHQPVLRHGPKPKLSTLLSFSCQILYKKLFTSEWTTILLWNSRPNFELREHDAVKRNKIIVFRDSIIRVVTVRKFNEFKNNGYTRFKVFPGANFKELLYFIDLTLENRFYHTAVPNVWPLISFYIPRKHKTLTL